MQSLLFDPSFSSFNSPDRRETCPNESSEIIHSLIEESDISCIPFSLHEMKSQGIYIYIYYLFREQSLLM